MKISIITVCYQSGATLRQAIESVLSQQDADIEYIVVDGGSTDGTVAMLEGYGASISKWVSEPDKGIYDAMNKGLLMATGDLVGFLHADDLLAHPRIIAQMAQAADELKADVVYGDLVYVQKENPHQVVRYWQSCAFEPKLLKRGWMPPHPTVYVRRHLYDTMGLFDLRFRIAADYDLMLRLFRAPGLKTVYLPQVMVRMRVGGASNRSLKNIIRKSKEDYQALRKNHVGGIVALMVKNLSKVGQFFKR